MAEMDFKRFKRFLKEQGAFIPFIKEFYNKKQIQRREQWYRQCSFKCTPKNSLADFFEKLKNKRDAVNFAFFWEASKQKYHFWYEISNKLREL